MINWLKGLLGVGKAPTPAKSKPKPNVSTARLEHDYWNEMDVRNKINRPSAPKNVGTTKSQSSASLPSTGGGGGGGGGYYGGGGGGGGGGGSSHTASTPLAIPKPKFTQPDPLTGKLVLKDWTPDFSTIDYFRPDYDGYNKAWETVFNSFKGLDDAHKAQQETAMQGLERTMNEVTGDIKDQRLANRQEFAKSRQLATENMLDSTTRNEENLAARGLSGSGVSQLMEAQNQMNLGRALSDQAQGYYGAEETMGKNLREAQNTYTDGTKALSNASQQYLAEIAQQKAHLTREQQAGLSALQRQETMDKTAVGQYKESSRQAAIDMANKNRAEEARYQQMLHEFNAQRFNEQQQYEMALNQFNQNLKQFDASRQDADRNYSLERDKFAHQQSSFNAQMQASANAAAAANANAGYQQSLAQKKFDHEVEKWNWSKSLAEKNMGGLSRGQAYSPVSQPRMQEVASYSSPQQAQDFLMYGGRYNQKKRK